MNLSLRFRVFMRDRFTCQYCGAKAPDAVLEVDHVVPVSSGGPTRMVNLVTACFACNRGKRDSILPPELAQTIVRPDVPKPPRPPRVEVIRQSREQRPVKVLIESLGRPYLGPDQPADEWRCSVCGFHNTAEHDRCSCDRPRVIVERLYCRVCDYEIEGYDDFSGLCEGCYEDLCVECHEDARLRDDDDDEHWDICANCRDEALKAEWTAQTVAAGETAPKGWIAWAT